MSQTENQKAKRIPRGKDASTTRRLSKTRRHFRLRKKIAGTAERPRLVVNRSSRHMHVQVINDLTGTTVAAASTIEADVRALEGDKKARGAKVGQLIAERAKLPAWNPWSSTAADTPTVAESRPSRTQRARAG